MLPDSAIANPAYQRALGWLYGLSPNVRTAAQIVADHPRKLARMRALLERVGRPDRRLASVLVAGTKGKGSIAACSESILRAAGYRTGLVTSPHLVSWCERTRIDGHDVEPSVVARLMPLVRAAVERLADEQPDLGQATTFEAGLALSLLALVERGIEIAVVETGVGGRHDATNVLEPLAVALGPISYDHTATLGPTLTAIATEKTGIFRAGRPAISARQPPEALAVVERAARERGARLELVGRAWRWRTDDGAPCRGAFTVDGPRGSYGGLTTPLLGRHQRENAAVAVALTTAVLERLGDPSSAPPPSPARTPQGRSQSSTSSPPAPAMAVVEPRLAARAVDAAVRAGLAAVRWPGRLQVLRERPWLVVDGAHNGDSAARLAEALGDCFEAGRRHLVFGTSVGKDVPRMLDALLPIASTVTVTRSHHERSVPLDDLTRALADRGVAPTVVPEVRDAVAGALGQSGPGDLVIVTGSLFVVGEALEAYGAADGGVS
jgi:dihydrofolate synthase/folylpolyglutamate synthase